MQGLVRLRRPGVAIRSGRLGLAPALLMELLFPLFVLGLMWVLLVRPQQQRVRRQRELVSSLQVGDEVVTAGGVIGRIVELYDDELRLEVSPGVTVRFVRLAVNARVDDTDEAVEEEVGADEDEDQDVAGPEARGEDER